MLIFVIPILVLLLLFLIYASCSIRSGVYIKTLCRNESKGKVVALTFDDGPDKERTSKILDTLKEFDAKACFFCVGSKIKGNEDILIRMKKEGHLIGNHSFNHFFSFPLYSSSRMENELNRFEQAIGEAVKEKTVLFRPPFGVTNPTVAKVINAMGYIPVGWSIRSFDTCMKEDAVVRRIQRRLKQGAVILLHDPLPQSDLLLRRILEMIKESGYNVEGIETLFDIPITSK